MLVRYQARPRAPRTAVGYSARVEGAFNTYSPSAPALQPLPDHTPAQLDRNDRGLYLHELLGTRRLVKPLLDCPHALPRDCNALHVHAQLCMYMHM